MRHKRPKGFSLIVVLVLMILITVVAIGLLNLSTVCVRSSTMNSAHAQAQANARMAMMMALAQLQQTAGPDQRVTATANMVDGVNEKKKYLTGIWDSGNWDPTSTDGKDKRFKAWLCSDPTIQSPSPLTATQDFAKSAYAATTDSRMITVLGKGSVNLPEEYVDVPSVSIQDSAGVSTGEYAYWVGDEGVKASYYTPTLTDNEWNRAGAVFSQPYPGSGKKPGVHTDVEKRIRVASKKSIALAEGVSTLGFHDYTDTSIGLLTDCRLGGNKVDLSTAFELPLADFNNIEEFHRANEKNVTDGYATLNASGYSKPELYASEASPSLGYLCEIPFADTTAGRGDPYNNPKGFVRGPSWDLLRNHYAQYKREWENLTWARRFSVKPTDFASHGSMPMSYSETIPGGNKKNLPFDYYASGGTLYSKGALSNTYSRLTLANQERNGINAGTGKSMIIPRSPKLMPQVLRVVYAFGLTKYKDPNNNPNSEECLMLSIDPYVVYHNPYNVPISVPGLGHFMSKFNPFTVEFVYTDLSGASQTATMTGFLSNNVFVSGSHSMRLAAPTILAPGAVKVMSPVSYLNGGLQVSYSGLTVLKGQWNYSEQSGIFGGSVNSIKPKPGTAITVRFKGKDVKQPYVENEHVLVTMHHTTDHAGRRRDIMTHYPRNGGIQGDEDIFDDPLIANISYSSHQGRLMGDILVEKTTNFSQVPSSSIGGSLYVAAMDVQMKPIGSDVPTMMFNSRGEAYDPRDYDGAQRSGIQWNANLVKIDDIASLELVSGQDGTGVWGTSYKSAGGGQAKVPLFEVPQLPLTSLSQLQHVLFQNTGSAQSYAIGNSFAHPGIPISSKELAYQRPVPNNGYSVTESQILSDQSWACNEALWDRYFFSGMNWGGVKSVIANASQPYTSQEEAVNALIAGDRSKAWPLQNTRYDLYRRSKSTTQLQADLKDYKKLSQYLAIFGAFNINSTSELAWKSLLCAVRDVEVRANGASASTITGSTPMSRFQVVNGDPQQMFGGFKDLTDAQLTEFAKAMVLQVKSRGPFMGLADFVNRSRNVGSVKGTDVAAVGALQAAILAAGINGTTVTKKPTAGNVENTSFSVNGKSATTSSYFGSSQYLTQADVLNSIGSVISARSDTFVIRAYGCAKDKNGKITAQAWCEATVQRTPDLMKSDVVEELTQLDPNYPSNPTKFAGLHQQYRSNTSISKMNQTFGRRFEIRSFRWLGPDEV